MKGAVTSGLIQTERYTFRSSVLSQKIVVRHWTLGALQLELSYLTIDTLIFGLAMCSGVVGPQSEYYPTKLFSDRMETSSLVS